MNAKCVKCDARCCRYFAVPLGMPAGDEDLDTARWYLLHAAATVFIDREGLWWLRVDNRCNMLIEGRQNKKDPASHGAPRCRDYRGRPLVCRRFSPKTCDYALGRWDHAALFRTPEELDDYVRRIPRLGRPKRPGRKKA